MRNLIVLSLSLLLFYSCSTSDKKKTFKLEDIEFVYAGPIFEGSNPAQYIATIDLKAILGDDYVEGIEIDKASLKKALVKMVNPESAVDINALVLSLASDNPELQMQELAVVNPISSNKGEVSLKPSPTAEATDFFAEKTVYVILDASFVKDVDIDVVLKGTFEFELEY